MKKYRPVLLTYGLITAIVLFFTIIVSLFLRSLFHFSFGVMLLADIFASLLISFIIFKIMMKKEKDNPISTLYSQMKKELQENGYSDKFIEIAEQGIRICSDSAHDFVYLKDFALFGAEAYISRDEIDKARQCINTIKIDEIKKKDITVFDGGVSLVTYFVVQMELCKAMNDMNRADLVYVDAGQYLHDFYGKTDVLSMLVDDFYICYYYMKQDYLKAKEHAEKVLKNKYHIDNNLVGSHINLMMIYNKLGEPEKVAELQSQIEDNISKTNSAISIQAYDLAKKKMAEGK